MRSIFYLPAVVLLVAAGFCSSCQTSVAGPPPDPQTEEFGRYLHSNFGDSIPHERHFFLLVAKKGSRQAATEKLAVLKAPLATVPAGRCSIIISSDMPVPDSLLPFGKCRTDWDGAIDRLEFLRGPVTLVRTQNGCIEAIGPVVAQEPKQLAAFFAGE